MWEILTDGHTEMCFFSVR